MSMKGVFLVNLLCRTIKEQFAELS